MNFIVVNLSGGIMFKELVDGNVINLNNIQEITKISFDSSDKKYNYTIRTNWSCLRGGCCVSHIDKETLKKERDEIVEYVVKND